jgi:hypothetical protein
MSKKINFLRAGALTMVLALGTTCFMSGTLAKYVTSGEGTDSARVAKFGVAVTANGETFAREYAKKDDSFTLAASTVVSSDNTDLVAPGTNGNMTSMILSGTPEVAVRVSYDVTELTATGWSVEGNEYFPISFTIKEGKNDTTPDVLTINSGETINDFLTRVEGVIENYSKDYAAGENLAGVGDDSLAISWAWPFSTSEANDVKDTALGDAAADDNASTIKLTVKTTVTQID